MKSYLRKGISVLLAMMLMAGSLSFLNGSVYAVETSKKIEVKQNIAEDLQQKLADAKDEFVDVMILFKDEASIQDAKIKSRAFNTPDSPDLKDRKAYIGTLKEVAFKSQNRLLSWLESEKNKGSVKEYQSFFIVNSMHVIAKKDIINKISQNAEVKFIELSKKMDKPIIDKPIRRRRKRMALPAPVGQVEWNINKIGADRVWQDFNITGKGVTVGIFDSEVSFEHPALKRKFKGYDQVTGTVEFNRSNYFDAIYFNKRPRAVDPEFDHGSHCMGVILGSEVNAAGEKVNQVGVAPDAKFIAAKVFSTDSAADTSGFLTAAQWMLAPDGKAENAPQIINNSWGGAAKDNNSRWFEEAVRNWRKAGILPVFASGNQGAGEPTPGPGSISTPGAYLDSLAVGAVNQKNALAFFSKRGPSAFGTDKDWKPELVAPGVSIRSSVANNYEYMSGTSMAAPHVTGVAALVKSANPSLKPDKIQEILQNTATPLTDATFKTSPNHGYGYGMVNAYNAVSEALGKGNGGITGKVLDSVSRQPVAAELYIKETARKINNDNEDGEFVLKHPSGNWTLVVNAYGYESQEISVDISKNQNLNKEILLVKKALNKVAVQVKDGRNMPIKGALVQILEDSNINFSFNEDSALYEANDVPSGTYTLRIFKDEFEIKEVPVVIPSAGTVEAVLEGQAGLAEKEISYDKGQYNTRPEDNFLVTESFSNDGGVVRFVPERKGALLTEVAVQICKTSYYTKGNTGLLSVMIKDEQGRMKTIQDDIKFTYQYDSNNIIPLAKYNIKVEQPFYVLIKSGDGSRFFIGMDQRGDRDYSYIFRDNNLIPIEREKVSGSLMIRAKLKYPTDGEKITYNVQPPRLEAIIPSESKVQGSAKARQEIQLVLPNTLKQYTMSDASGKFEFKLNSKLNTGETVTCYAKDDNGIKSEPTYGIVLTDSQALRNLMSRGESIIEKAGQLDVSKLREKMDAAKKLLDGIKIYEKGQVDSENLRLYQSKIREFEQEIRKIINQLIPEKETLLALIEKARKNIDEVWINDFDGRDVPRTKKYVSELQWIAFNNEILNAIADYNDTGLTTERINATIEALKNATNLFDSIKKQGTQEVLEISEKYRDGIHEGEGRATSFVANHVVVTIKKGRILDIKIKEWNSSSEARHAIENSDFFARIIANNALDVKLVKGYEIESRSIIKAIQQALEKALKEGEKNDIDRTRLAEKIAKAEKLLAATPVSKDGKDVPNGTKWVTDRVHKDFAKAIADAKKELAKPDLTMDLRDRAITTLTTAEYSFISNQNDGVIEVIEDSKNYRDGVYTTSAVGKNTDGKNTFKIHIVGGKISKIEVVDWQDTPGYFEKLQHNDENYNMVDAIIKGNTSEVDTVSNATMSSKSLRKAVELALKEASKPAKPEDEDNSGDLAAKVERKVAEAKKLLFETNVEGSSVKLLNRNYTVNRDSKNKFIKSIKSIAEITDHKLALQTINEAIDLFKSERKAK